MFQCVGLRLRPTGLLLRPLTADAHSCKSQCLQSQPGYPFPTACCVSSAQPACILSLIPVINPSPQPSCSRCSPPPPPLVLTSFYPSCSISVLSILRRMYSSKTVQDQVQSRLATRQCLELAGCTTQCKAGQAPNDDASKNVPGGQMYQE